MIKSLEVVIVVVVKAAIVGVEFVVQGMGGIGKSVLAAALARDIEIRRAFPDGIFWVDIGQQPAIVSLQHRLIRELGGQASFTNQHEGREQLRELIQNRAVLLILDDCWRRENAEAFS